jgi:hypothetical protein
MVGVDNLLYVGFDVIRYNKVPRLDKRDLMEIHKPTLFFRICPGESSCKATVLTGVLWYSCKYSPILSNAGFVKTYTSYLSPAKYLRLGCKMFLLRIAFFASIGHLLRYIASAATSLELEKSRHDRHLAGSSLIVNISLDLLLSKPVCCFL